MYPTHTPALIRRLLRDLVWRVPDRGRSVYLTFDDGPAPGVTPWVLDLLAEHGAKATFFCVGRNAEAHPEIMARIRAEGHAIGNHTHEHVNGWRTDTYAYLRDVLRCQASTGSTLFRPPYGRITPAQLKALRKRFHVIMWDVLSADFDSSISGEQCLRNVIGHSGPGSIIVFHDSPKAEARLRHVLPSILSHFVRERYAMKALAPGPIGPTGR
jgi:peptidoglycan-N-acetylglucosamine deacetylase